ncbi:MAG: T9SS type A sorting domain-containing protein [Vicingaceae bacterium]|nr:T9SS type A sorting domain-containing protein [Vicingaceae bacterium]
MKKIYLLAISIMGFQAINAQITNYTTIPYATGFESGTLDNNWYTTSSSQDGRIQIWNSTSLIWSGDTAKAHTDSLWLGMDNSPGGSYVTNEAWIGLDLLGETQVRFTFWWAEWNDETEPQDGIYISDDGGTSFTKVLDLNGASYTDLQWYYFDLNLDSLNTVHGLNFTATYVIKLQQYDNYYFAGGNDGFLFDDINVESTIVSNISEQDEVKVKVFPNPTTDFVNISLSKSNNNYSYQLYSIDGQLIEENNSINENSIKLNLSDYNAGVYFVNLYSNGEMIHSHKLFKQ